MYYVKVNILIVKLTDRKAGLKKFFPLLLFKV